MLITIIIISLALSWLLYETDFMKVQLESTEYQNTIKNQSMVNPNSDIPDNSTPYKPAVFTPLDMPVFTGNINIICERG